MAVYYNGNKILDLKVLGLDASKVYTKEEIDAKIKAINDTITNDFIGNEVDNYITVNPNAGSYNYGVSLNPDMVLKDPINNKYNALVSQGYLDNEFDKFNVKNKLDKKVKDGVIAYEIGPKVLSARGFDILTQSTPGGRYGWVCL